MTTGVSLSGAGNWLETTGNAIPGTVVSGALLDQGTKLLLTLQTNLGTYSVRMESVSGEYFQGAWTKGNTGNGANGHLFKSQTGGYFFFGTWKEEREYVWWFQLAVGEAISDEDD